MRKTAAIGVLLAMAISAGAESGPSPIALPVTHGTDLRFDHLALGTDPSHRRITGFAQDDFGFLWLGTDDGLMRYDGYRIRAFCQDPGNPNSLGDTYVIALFKDARASFGFQRRHGCSMCTIRAWKRSLRSGPTAGAATDFLHVSAKSTRIGQGQSGWRLTTDCTR